MDEQRLTKEVYQAPVLTKHEPLVDITGQVGSSALGSPVLQDPTARQKPYWWLDPTGRQGR